MGKMPLSASRSHCSYKRFETCHHRRFNIRELPRGGSGLKWHTDQVRDAFCLFLYSVGVCSLYAMFVCVDEQPAIYPVCPTEEEDESHGFLDDAGQGSILAPPQGEVDATDPVLAQVPAAPGPSAPQ
tara:strand:+ start:405 stop:785 length:381 start_codon:yes stop_codon:yes gene_type:complete